MSSKTIAIIAGVGPGTGAAIARKFASAYPVALLSRNPDTYIPIVDAINSSGGKAIGISTDVSDSKSVKGMVEKVKHEYGNDVKCAAAIFNASGAFVRKPFLELTEEVLDASYAGSVKGSFLFSQATLPLLLAATTPSTSTPTPPHPPTLIFTGATASVKSSALFAAFATMKYALRALAQSLAREFGPQGVHVAHAVIDGVINVPRTQAYGLPAEAKIDPRAIADAYWHLHTQPKTSFTWEIDIRPGVEKW
ncbi:hypothetical protein HO133_006988 [Letharia lupina]|uniref:NAD(P)-binding protein n=1 Tax=Letharia lupina TaxID=560253 RepID=A0A8H6FHL1_9LECA|nr:uncharacterized protein HO133_006988 [Letharia lupina]KAF6228877.1 hypothetical protein HO133_006988 [Letharia lupina]